ncbi:putative ATPase N2B [Centruroides sculpturatus]|uniref:putative ATPase N2B n=1 Tax=Centruroides sculpturatus TaxID=218467 RepID=UPI000C6DEE5A|nr:putative ATPase N2B [Centruroides sculpturatus]
MTSFEYLVTQMNQGRKLSLLFSRQRGVWFYSVKFHVKVPVACYSTKQPSGEILNVYRKKLDSGDLRPDEHQLEIVHHLCHLQQKIKNYSPKKHGLIYRFLKGVEKPEKRIKGIYLHGSVGCGKTMLMDLFFNHCGVTEKHRVHYNSFMLGVHAKIHECKKTFVRDRNVKSLQFDPIKPVVQELISKSWLLCLDEFQVTDIGDAMILKRLFTELFRNGVIVVATSNRRPDDLYKNGLQRSNFLPFIGVLKEYCNILLLDSGIDYRQKFKSGKHVCYFIKSNLDANKELNQIFKILAARETDVVRPKTLTIKGRNVLFSVTCGQVADCTFDELCNRPLGAGDYLLMSQVFHTVIIRDIPQMMQSQKTQARRFITLIDIFYDNKVRILCSADVPHTQLFTTVGNAENLNDENRALMDDLGITAESEDSKASIFSGEEEIFAFDRTISRLAEMQTEEYWNQRGIS